jgi:hypothetical protein
MGSPARERCAAWAWSSTALAAPLRRGHLVKYMSTPLLLTRLMKLLTHDRTGRYIGSLHEDLRQVSTYRHLETQVYFYAEALETDQAAYELL